MKQHRNPAQPRFVSTSEISFRHDSVTLSGTLSIPAQIQGAVLFAHGSGSSRFSPRNQQVAKVLQSSGFATLLLDLLTEREAQDREYVFDIELLALRLSAAQQWAHTVNELVEVGFGYFGASTGAAAALIAAAESPAGIRAVVSRGGRPDLAERYLADVRCPTLLIVGSLDEDVLELNRGALAEMHCPKKLEVVSGATHLFEEPGTLDEVSRLAQAWFERYLPEK